MTVETVKILKWLLLILIAGFIGQFGRHFANLILSKSKSLRGKKEEGAERTESGSPDEQEKGLFDKAMKQKDNAEVKYKKKKKKNLVKLNKKG